MAGLFEVFPAQLDLLGQLLPRTEAREDDRHLLERFQPGQPDEGGRHVEDLHLLPHLQDEDFASPPQGGRLQNELGRFGNRHEVAFHIRVRDRDRSAREDLLPECRTTDPAESMTFPNLTAMKRVPFRRARSWITSSATRFEAPMTELGFTALSVEIRTNVPTRARVPARRAGAWRERCS